jgi:hypothetical protein
MSTAARSKPASMRDRAAGLEAAGWKFWRWRPIGQSVARSNARGASISLAEQRVEREDVEDFVTRLAEEREPREDPQ